MSFHHPQLIHKLSNASTDEMKKNDDENVKNTSERTQNDMRWHVAVSSKQKKSTKKSRTQMNGTYDKYFVCVWV